MNGAILSQMAILFILIALGFFINKIGLLNDKANGLFTKFLLNITLPATIISSAMGNSSLDKMSVLWVMIVAVAIFLVMPVVSWLVCTVLRMKGPVYQMMLTYSNLGFMGIPVVSSMFGEQYAFYCSVFMMIYNVHIFSVGVIMLQGKGGRANKKMLFKKLCSPAIISSVLAFGLVFIHIPMPGFVTGVFSSVGSITTPLAMILIGSQLAEASIISALKNYRIYIMTFFKLIVYPAVTFIVLAWIMGPDSMVAKVAAVEIGLPVGSTVTMLCTEYKKDQVSLAAEGTCISTILSLATIPLMLLFIG